MESSIKNVTKHLIAAIEECNHLPHNLRHIAEPLQRDIVRLVNNYDATSKIQTFNAQKTNSSQSAIGSPASKWQVYTGSIDVNVKKKQQLAMKNPVVEGSNWEVNLEPEIVEAQDDDTFEDLPEITLENADVEKTSLPVDGEQSEDKETTTAELLAMLDDELLEFFDGVSGLKDFAKNELNMKFGRISKEKLIEKVRENLKDGK